MNKLVKVLIGTAVVAGVGAIAAAVKEDKDQDKKLKEAKTEVQIEKAKKDIKENPSLLKRIRKFVTKKVVKFLAFVALHMEQIEAAGAVIGLGSAVISIVGAIKDFKQGNDTQEKLDYIIDRIRLDEACIYHNQKVMSTGLEFIAEKVEVDSDELCKALEAIA